MGLYVETVIDADMEVLWERTQDPARHQSWDLRFTSISCLPRVEGEPRAAALSLRDPAAAPPVDRRHRSQRGRAAAVRRHTRLGAALRLGSPALAARRVQQLLALRPRPHRDPLPDGL